MAGIVPDQLDVAEISARYAHEELLYGEALGLWKRSDVSSVSQSKNGAGQRVKVNPSGGAISGNPTTVAGLTRTAEVYLQLSGRAGEHQVKDATHGLAHGAAGLCGQSQMVIVMRRGDA
jgi:acetyl-CoA C-acetyltransferase